jgi:hypothetical protein
VAIYAAVDDKRCADHGVIPGTARQPLGPQRDFEGAGNLEIVDADTLAGGIGDILGKGIPAVVDDPGWSFRSW